MDRKAERLNRCPDAQAMLPAYVEGELSEQERSRVEGHLKICSACRKETAEFQSAMGALRAAPRQESPRDLYYGFAEKLEVAEKRSRRLMRRLRFAGAAACLLLVVGVSASPLIHMLTRKEAPFVPQPLQNRIVSTPPSDKPVRMVNVPVNIEPNKSWSPAKPDAGEKTDLAASSSNSTEAPAAQEKVTPAPKDNSKVKGPEDVDFLHVQPKQGPSAADRIAQAKERSPHIRTSGEIDNGYMPKDRSLPRQTASIAPYTQDRYERVEVGGMETTIKTGYKLDEEGKKKSIHIEIGTTQEK